MESTTKDKLKSSDSVSMYSLIFTDGARKIENLIDQKGLDNFPKNISYAEKSIDNLVMAYFNGYLPKGKNQQKLIKRGNKGKGTLGRLNKSNHYLYASTNIEELDQSTKRVFKTLGDATRKSTEGSSLLMKSEYKSWKKKLIRLNTCNSKDNSNSDLDSIVLVKSKGPQPKQEVNKTESTNLNILPFKPTKGLDNSIKTLVPPFITSAGISSLKEKLSKTSSKEKSRENDSSGKKEEFNEETYNIYKQILSAEDKIIELRKEEEEEDDSVDNLKSKKRLVSIIKTLDEKAPIFLKIKNEGLKRAVLDNKDQLNKRRGLLITQEQKEEFLRMMEKEKEEAERVHSKVFKNPSKSAEKTSGMMAMTPLTQIYVKCSKGLKESEQMKDYLNYVITQKAIKEKLERKEQDKRRKKLNEEKFLENENEVLKNALNNKRKYDAEFLRENERHFKQQKLRVDVIPKISENLAFQNRNTLMKIFDYNYFADKDFLFMNEYKKIKEEMFVKNMNGRESIRKNIRSEDLLLQNLETDLRDKNLLLKRLEEDNEKYIRNGYYIIHGKEWTDKMIIDPPNLVKRKEPPDFEKVFARMRKSQESKNA